MTNKIIFSIIIIFVILLPVRIVSLDNQIKSVKDELKNNIILSFETQKIISESSSEYYNSSNSKPKSIKKAILYSAILPGWGEYYAGRKDKAKYFFAAEVITWITYFSFRTYGNWRKDDMIRLAAEKANADLNNKDDHFYDMVGFYENVHEYNSLGRISDPGRPYYYDTSGFYWNWQSIEDRHNYRELKNSFRSAYKNSETVIGLAILNRLISIVDAVRDVKSYNRKITDRFTNESKGIKLQINPIDETNQVALKWYIPL